MGSGTEKAVAPLSQAQAGHQRALAEQEILAAVRAVNYGSVEIVIHDSAIVQIERREKVRFESSGNRHQSRSA